MRAIKISITIQTDEFDEEVLLTIVEARELWERLNELFNSNSEPDKVGMAPAFTEIITTHINPIQPAVCPSTLDADIGRTVWATDGDGNPISPDELKARNRERSDKWADVGKKFAAGANQSDRPDYYCKSSGGPWEPFLTTFEYEPRWLSRRDSRHVRMGLTIVHSLRWGDPQVTGVGGVYRRWDCVNGFTE